MQDSNVAHFVVDCEREREEERETESETETERTRVEEQDTPSFKVVSPGSNFLQPGLTSS